LEQSQFYFSFFRPVLLLFLQSWGVKGIHVAQQNNQNAPPQAAQADPNAHPQPQPNQPNQPQEPGQPEIMQPQPEQPRTLLGLITWLVFTFFASMVPDAQPQQA
jgi:hypothetical protein